MRLFSYYALHSFWNQLRKLFRTWVLVFILVCALVGGLIGFGAAMLSEAAEENRAPETAEETLPPEEAEAPSPEEALSEAEHREDRLSMVELAAGAIILALLVYNVLSADKNGSKIFLPADVNLLFPSPLSPQRVLMFRLGTQIGTAIAASLYLLFQLPTLINILGLSFWGSLAIIAAWGLAVIAAKLVQVLLYLLCSNHPALRSSLHRIVYILLALIGGAFLLFWRRSEALPLEAAKSFFNAPVSRYIPVWGWIKGFCLYALEGNIGASLVCLGLTVLFCVLLAACIRRIPADFYEDAMAQSQETAELLEQVENGALVVRRKKDRSESLRRNDFHRGWGAGVFFHKTLYNRFRFAHLGFFTKTMETYLAAGVAAAVLCRTVLPWDGALTVALALAVLAFFRAMGNPLGEDTRMDFFRLIPEHLAKKLAASVLGGLVNTLLDLLPGLFVGTLIARGSLLAALGWVPFILSVDLYATCVSTFIDLSIPLAVGKMLKSLIQVLFIYFGLLPDAALIGAGFAFERLIPAALAAAGVNMLLAVVFFSLSPRYLEPSHRYETNGSGQVVDITLARHRFSRMGWALLVLLLLGSLIQSGISFWIQAKNPVWASADWALWLVTFLPLYLVAFPVGALWMKNLPAAPPVKGSVTFSGAVKAVLVSFCMMVAGNMIGTGINLIISSLTDTPTVNPVETYAYSGALGWKLAFLVVIGPLWEEVIFRKLLIDRMRPYGERLALITSAVLFGLFHGNLSQLFYATALGLVFGYVYLRTGRLWCSAALHMLINLLGGVISTALPEGLTGYYSILLFVMAAAGAGLLILNIRRIRFQTMETELPSGERFRPVWLNAGMILNALLCLASILAVIFSV